MSARRCAPSATLSGSLRTSSVSSFRATRPSNAVIVFLSVLLLYFAEISIGNLRRSRQTVANDIPQPGSWPKLIESMEAHDPSSGFDCCGQESVDCHAPAWPPRGHEPRPRRG